jgi:hypothetical protein
MVATADELQSSHYEIGGDKRILSTVTLFFPIASSRLIGRALCSLARRRLFQASLVAHE